MVSCVPLGVRQLPVKALAQSGEPGREISRSTERLGMRDVRC